MSGWCWLVVVVVGGGDWWVLVCGGGYPGTCHVPNTAEGGKQPGKK